VCVCVCVFVCVYVFVCVFVFVCVCVCVSFFEILSKVTDFMKITYKNKIIRIKLLHKP